MGEVNKIDLMLEEVDIRKLLILIYDGRWYEFLKHFDKRYVVKWLYRTDQVIDLLSFYGGGDIKKAMCTFMLNFVDVRKRKLFERLLEKCQFEDVIEFYKYLDDGEYPDGFIEYLYEELAKDIPLLKLALDFDNDGDKLGLCSNLDKETYEMVLKEYFGDCVTLSFCYNNCYECDIFIDRITGKCIEMVFSKDELLDRLFKCERLLEFIEVDGIIYILWTYVKSTSDDFLNGFIRLCQKLGKRKRDDCITLDDLPKKAIMDRLSHIPFNMKKKIYDEFCICFKLRDILNDDENIFLELCKKIKNQ